MYVEASWALVSLETHVQPQVIVDPDYLPDYLSVSYGYGYVYVVLSLWIFKKCLCYKQKTASILASYSLNFF